MNEILQKRIEAESNKYMEEAIEMNGVVGDNLHYKDLKTCFIEAADFALQNQWISVDEALPPLTQTSGKVYLTIDKNGYADIKARNLDGWSSPRSWCSTEQITHWMCIPSLEGGEK